MPQTRRTLALGCLIALWAVPAQAHMLDTPSELLTGFLHPLLEPVHAPMIVALGLSLARLDRVWTLRVLAGLIAGTYAGGLTTLLSGALPGMGWALPLSTIALALLVLPARAWTVPLVILATLAGVVHGAANLAGLPGELDLTGFLTGVMVAMALGAALVGWLAGRLPDQARLIASRIAASWIIAIALLISLTETMGA